MTERTRRNILRYGIAIDLVVLATAVGMLLTDAPTASLLVPMFAAAVSLSTWRGEWRGGVTALLLSIAAIAAAFPQVLNATEWAMFAGASLIGATVVGSLTRKRAAVAVPEPVLEPEPMAEVVPFAERESQERLASERRAEEERAHTHDHLETHRTAVEDELRRQLDQERTSLRADAEREAAEHERHQRAEKDAAKAAASPTHTSFFGKLPGWFRRKERPPAVNVKTKREAAKRAQNAAAKPVAAPSAPAKPRLLFIERRRAIADTTAAKLKNRGVESEVVERWVDAVDALFRFKPHALLLDIEHAEFSSMHGHILEKSAQLPIVLTGRRGSAPPGVTHAAFVARPYDTDELLRLAQQALAHPEELLAAHAIARAALPRFITAPEPPPSKAITSDEYEITCFSCKTAFNAIDADWCSCIAKERTLVCTNCLTCFCKASPAFLETFWMRAPQRMFERRTSELRQGSALSADPRRPLVLSVEHDEEIQSVVQRVCSHLDCGFIPATNGQEGLDRAREYRPDLILTGASLPQLDGYEMCRQLKEDAAFAETPMVIVTGLYADMKYRDEAAQQFHVDDFIAKPVAVTDLINLLQKHLQGVTGVPAPEDLHALHRKGLDANAQSDTPASLLERKMIVAKRNVEMPRPDRKRPLVLLVNDDENVQLIVRTVAMNMGYGFVLGANQEEGMSLAREHSPEMILADAFTPTLNGRELCRRLKENPTTAQSISVLMTGLYSDRDSFQVDDCVPKPVAANDLMQLFKKHLAGKVRET